MSSNPRAPALAVVGAGAIAERFHLPALARHPEVIERLTLVDVDRPRADRVSRSFGISRTAVDYRTVLSEVEGAIIALPHHLHYEVIRTCVAQGTHVLAEKPLCDTAAEARDIVEAAARTGATVTVNNTRRLYPSCVRAAELIRDGAIGDVRRLEFDEGDVFGWPIASGAVFGANGSARGVLQDRGAHALDLVCWWLGGKPELTGYRDDWQGGSEAVAHLEFRHANCVGEVKLSWLSRLANQYRITGTEGSLDGKVFDWRILHRTDPHGRRSMIRVSKQPSTDEAFAHQLLDNFIDVVAGNADPLIRAEDVMPSIELIDECYERRTRFAMPWADTAEVIARVG